MEADLLVKWSKNGRRTLTNRDHPKYHSVNGSSIPLRLIASDQEIETIQHKPFSISGDSDDDEMIDITARGTNMDSHFEHAHTPLGKFLLAFFSGYHQIFLLLS